VDDRSCARVAYLRAGAGAGAGATAVVVAGGRVLASADPVVSHRSTTAACQRAGGHPTGRHLYRGRSTATGPSPHCRFLIVTGLAGRTDGPTGRLIASSLSGVALRRAVDVHQPLVDRIPALLTLTIIIKIIIIIIPGSNKKVKNNIMLSLYFSVCLRRSNVLTQCLYTIH